MLINIRLSDSEGEKVLASVYDDQAFWRTDRIRASQIEHLIGSGRPEKNDRKITYMQQCFRVGNLSAPNNREISYRLGDGSCGS